MRLDFETFTTAGPTLTDDDSPPAEKCGDEMMVEAFAKVCMLGFTLFPEGELFIIEFNLKSSSNVKRSQILVC